MKGIAAVWAPAGDGANDPVAYTKAIQSLTGFSDATMDKKYSELSSEQQALFRAAQKRIEQGAPAATTKTTTTTTPAATTTTGGVSGGARARQEGEVAGTKEFSSQLGKQHADMAVQIDKSGIGAPEAYNRATDILNIAEDKDMQDMFGILRQKGVAPFILKQLESGVQAGQFGSIGLKDLSKNLTEAGASPEQIKKFDRLERHLAQAELEWAKTYLKGQGAVSDAERELFKAVGGSTLNSYQMLERIQKGLDAKSRFDAAASDLRAANPRQNWVDFKSSPEYRDLAKNYVNELKDISKTVKQRPQSEQQTAPMSGTTSGKIEWKVVTPK